jgi:hypothetical protein
MLFATNVAGFSTNILFETISLLNNDNEFKKPIIYL